MTTNIRTPETELTGVFGAVVRRFSRKLLGEVPEPLGVYANNPSVLKTFISFSGKVQKWDACDENLKSFAHMAAVSQIGCSFCLDLGYFMAHNDGLDEAKAREVPGWRESDVFTPLERDVMAYAEAMTETPTAVTDDMSRRLLDQLGPAAMVELTSFIAMANFAARANTAFGIEAQGFAASCGLAPFARPSAVASPA